VSPAPFAVRYGPTALVTGASSGIGRALACEAAARGLDLVLVARRDAVLRDLAGELAARHGVRADALPLDLADPAAPARLAEQTADRDIGLLVAAAGFGTSGPLAGAPLAPEREMLQVNCGAVLELASTFGARAVARGRGGLVLLSSVVAFQGVPHAAHYAATKAYVQSLAEGLHGELAPHGVDVLAAAPGPVASGFAERAGLAPGRTLDPDAIAPRILDGLGRRPTTVPGALSRLLKDSLAPLPRRARVRVMGKVMAGMTAHNGA
jgi:short-subunit dehydrogenase